MAVLSPPFALGSPSVVHPARLDRLTLAGLFLPGAGVAVRTGVLHGPTGQVGATALAGTNVTVDPARWIIQSTHSAVGGSYIVTNDAAALIPVPARDPANPRRALIAVWAADAEAANLPSNATNDGGFLAALPGDPAAVPGLPAAPANSIILGELLIPSTANGGAITYTPATVPVTALRGQPLPVANAAARTALTNLFPGLDVIELDTGRRYTRTANAWQQLLSPADLTSYVRYFATQTARVAATGDFDGQLAVELDNDRYLRWTGGAWRYISDHLAVANAAARDGLTAYAGLEVRLIDTGVAYFYDGAAWQTVIPAAATPPQLAALTASLALTTAQTSATPRANFVSIPNVLPGTYLVEANGDMSGTTGNLILQTTGGAATGSINTFSVAPGTSNNAFTGTDAQAINATGGTVIGRGPFGLTGVLVVTATTTVGLTVTSSYTITAYPGTFLRLTKIA